MVLPLSSRLGLPFLLGGTSNWFRAEALRQAGGWDAHTTAPDRLRREKVAKALRRNSALRGRIERSRREAETLGGGRILNTDLDALGGARAPGAPKARPMPCRLPVA